MAYEIPGKMVTVPASTDMTGLQYRFVTIGTDGRAALPAVGDPVFGVLQNKPLEDQAASVMIDGISKVVAAGSTVSAGQIVSASSVGLAITQPTGGYAVGRVVSGSSGSTGRVLTVEITAIGTT